MKTIRYKFLLILSSGIIKAIN